MASLAYEAFRLLTGTDGLSAFHPIVTYEQRERLTRISICTSTM
jgi:hypothetical protein